LHKRAGRPISPNFPAGLQLPTNTLIFAAWGIVLAAQNNAPDVALMVLRSGRHVPVPGVEDMFGQALIRVPVGIKLADRTRTVPNFLVEVAKDLGESRNHDLWDEEAFKAISAETKAHAEAMTFV